MSENNIDLSELTDEQQQQILKRIEEFKKENNKTLLDKAAEEYTNKITAYEAGGRVKDFKAGAKWLSSIWKQIRDPTHSIATISDFDDFIRKECK